MPPRGLGKVQLLHVSDGSYLILQAAGRGWSKVFPRSQRSARKSAETLAHFAPVIKAALLIKDRAFGFSLLLISVLCGWPPEPVRPAFLNFKLKPLGGR